MEPWDTMAGRSSKLGRGCGERTPAEAMPDVTKAASDKPLVRMESGRDIAGRERRRCEEIFDEVAQVIYIYIYIYK